MNNYTFEQYEDAAETRAWFVQFLEEHNGPDWEENLPFPLSDFVSRSTLPSLNGEPILISWYRIKCDSVLVGYADVKAYPLFNGRKVISDVWILPQFRNRGHYHRSFSALVNHTTAVAVCVSRETYRLYGEWYASFGFDHASALFVPEPLFLTTKEAHRDMVRFLIKYVPGICPTSERSRAVFEDVKRELRGAEPQGAVPSD